MNHHFLGKSDHFWGSIVTLGWPLYTISNPKKNLDDANILTAPISEIHPLQSFVSKLVELLQLILGVNSDSAL